MDTSYGNESMGRRKWRFLQGQFIKNPRRLRRHSSKPEIIQQNNRIIDRIRVAIKIGMAAERFLDSGIVWPVPEAVREAGFGISPEELAVIASNHRLLRLNHHGGVGGISNKLQVSLKEGIKEDTIEVRKDIYGTNKHDEKPSKRFWNFVWDALHDLTLIILMVCAVISVIVGLFTEGFPKGMYDGIGIILSILLVVIVTSVSDYRQSLQFIELDNEKKKIYVHVTRDGIRQKMLIYDLVVGDVVHLSLGDQVPADGLFVSGYSLMIDESSLTGESEHVHISHKKPFLRSGTKVVDGSAKMLVTAVGMNTEWGKLMSTLSHGGEDETPLQVKLNDVAALIGQIGLAFATLTFLVLLSRFCVAKYINGTAWSTEDASIIVNYFAIAVTIIVVAVPEGLPLAVTLSLAFAMKKLMDSQALVRHLSACETMGSAGHICTDKTGTLTTNHMVVNKIWMCDMTKSLSYTNDTVKDLYSVIPKNALSVLLQCIFENTSSEVVRGKDGKNTILGTPTEIALLEFAVELETIGGLQYDKHEMVKIEPFNSEKKMMSVVISVPGGYRLFCKGASEIILDMCDKLLDKEGNVIPMSRNQAKDILAIINGFASEALRTISVAFRDLDEFDSKEAIPKSRYTFIAIVGIKDPVRPGVKESVKTCMDAGVMVHMVTGDNINTAKAIAKECGILTDDGIAIEGPVFRTKRPEELKELIPKIQVMARSSPLDKLKFVEAWKDMFNVVVAVTGDGTNDAPALNRADIGVAMGISGTEVAKESADVIVLDDNFSTIVVVAKWGRSVYINIQKFVQFQLTVNIVALIVNFFSACIIGTAPLTAVQLLWVNMIMDTLGALALATEPPHDDLMKRPPVRKEDSLITMTMWRNIIGQSLYQLVVLGILVFQGKKIFNLSGVDADATLNTLIFNSFVFCQVFNEINSREMEKINVFEGMLGNWIFMGIIAGTVFFQVIIVEFLGTFANTVPLSWQFWLLSIVLGSISMIIAVILKQIPVEAVLQSIVVPKGYEPLPAGPDGV
ncbi:Calcium-transporting ATPase [Rhynchospora pubera]|uniref:Calcium-transporting ATPase n=1 Tax=Rhynchospora pubera TaxID=906938 RepID=A0AAV8DL59_9POAL|nr:Calcium-transporting ATPase [Rhynchospora pubera]